MFIVCFCLVLAKKLCFTPSRTNKPGTLAERPSLPPHSEEWNLAAAPTRGGDRGRTGAPKCCLRVSDGVQRWGGSAEPPVPARLGGDALGVSVHPTRSPLLSLRRGCWGPVDAVAVHVHPEDTYKGRGGQRLHEINPGLCCCECPGNVFRAWCVRQEAKAHPELKGCELK